MSAPEYIGPKPKAFILKADRMIRDDVSAKAGDIVFQCLRYDYGGASEDTRMMGEKYVSVTLNPTGDYPFFTVAERELEPRP